ncbi:MAG: transketolase [Chitinispirillaceae bacterium]|nr:transketolase [Chitinispirillaceae bacterium]
MERARVIERAADNIRILAAAMVEKAKSGHPGGAMGGADFINILYSEFLNFDPSDPAWFCRDRFFLDPGHMSAMLYAQLVLTRHYSMDDIKNFRQWGSVTPGHPERNVMRGIENTSGPLGQGHVMAVGAAIAERFLVARFGEWMAHKTYTFISDGGVQEEVSQGAGRIAGHLGLSNLIMFYDSNDVQLSTMTSDVTGEDTAKKYAAWGWSVITINGNDQNQIRDALDKAHAEKERPTLIIGKTIMGKGAVAENGQSCEGRVSTHGMPLSEAGASFAKTVERLGGNPEDPFRVFPEVAEYYATICARKAETARELKARQAAWEKAHPQEAKKLSGYIAGTVPQVNWSAIQPKPGCATRAASAAVLGQFVKEIGNMIVSSADLANSDKTDGFLKGTTILKKGDFNGAFLQSGVAELTMAALMNGIAAHGGVIPVCGTFFTFSDYMKPAVRLAALMGLPVTYVWSHDSFRVGEDGPTHQPVEHEAQIRLLEKMNNLEGRRSMLVLRPADMAETVAAWKLALECTESPCALLLSRQNIADLPARSGGDRLTDAQQAGRGGYTVVECDGKPDVILAASGSEVGTLYEASKILKQEKNLACRIVSLPSTALFDEQPDAYRESVMTPGVPVFGLTAGLPAALNEAVGPLGKVVGLTRFGASAPYKVLDKEFGFTAENMAEQIVKYLGEYPAMRKKIG